MDAPVGAGYSYSTTQSGYVLDDYKHVAQLYEFLQKVGQYFETNNAVYCILDYILTTIDDALKYQMK